MTEGEQIHFYLGLAAGMGIIFSIVFFLWWFEEGIRIRKLMRDADKEIDSMLKREEK